MSDVAADCRALAESIRSGPLARSAYAPTSQMAMTLAKHLDKMADLSDRVDRLFAKLDVDIAHINKQDASRRVFH